MMILLVAALALSAPAVRAEKANAAVTPVQKVIEMMTEMQAKGIREAEAEVKIMDEYTEWVDDTCRQLEFEIKTAKADIEKLTATIEKAMADISALSDEIAVLDADIATWEGNQKAATTIRDKEHAEYEVEQKDLSESVDALGRAIQVLSNVQADTPQAAEALLQKMAVTMPPMRKVLAAFLEEQSSKAPFGAPAVAAYESQSGGIVEMLEKLEKKFSKELADCEEEEANKAHNYDLEMLHLSNSIKAATEDREEKAAVKAERTAAKAEAEGQLADTKADLAEDEKTLADTQATFEVKKTAFAANQEVRKAELAAIKKAIEIISSGAVSGAADKHLPGAASSFVQLRSTAKTLMGTQLRTKAASEYLEKQAERLGSKVLSLAAVRAGADPFAKVTKMIRELIDRLKEEAAAEAEHKAYCDKELHDNKNTRDEKSAKVDQLTAQSEELGAVIAKLGEEIQVLIEEQAALDKAMKEATEVRGKEKEKNTATIADAKAAQEAVGQALAVLKEFYAKAGGEEALLQQVPEMKAYKGMQGAKKGVVGMLEVIMSDFARLEAETTAEETEAQSAYDTFMADSTASKEQKHKDEFDKSLLKDKKEFELKHVNEDLRNTQDELDAALLYYEKLKPECIEVKVSYEERVKRREEEIEALKEAYKILDAYNPPSM